MRRLIISDLHIGSLFSRESDIINLFQTIQFDELILAGDIIDFIKVPIFTKNSLILFEILSNIKVPIKYIIGNHDISFGNFEGTSFNNIYFTKKYDFIDEEKKIRVEHGDDYDNYIIKWFYLMNIIAIIGNIIERFFNVDILEYWENYRYKKKGKININNIMIKNNDVDIFIMGHTHRPEILEVNLPNVNKKIKYCNSGDWVSHKSYLILENGEVTLHSF